MTFDNHLIGITKELIESYHSVNSSSIDVLTIEPTPLQFLKYLGKNRPFVVRGGCRGWPALQEWNVAYFEKMMGDTKIEVAETPSG